MEIIQVVLDKKLLRDADRAARRTKQNRSALIREALRAHLRQMEIAAQGARERAGYARIPDDPAEANLWEREAVWPPE